MEKDRIFNQKKEMLREKEEMIAVDRIKHHMEMVDKGCCPVHGTSLIKGKCRECGGVCYTC